MGERLESRNEKRLRKQAVRAAKERKCKLEDGGQLSLPSDKGKLVIAVSRVRSSHDLYDSKGKDPQYFRLEAERLEEERAGDHQEVVLRERASTAQMRRDFGDSEVSDIILIGNGTINALSLDGGQYFDWRDAARSATTLKQGRVEQRMCGNFPSEIPYHVPLGTFAVSELTSVIAAAGEVIPDHDPPDERFQPVFSSPDDPLGQIQGLNNRFAGMAPIIIGDNRQLASI
jgi:hypothetical protein